MEVLRRKEPSLEMAPDYSRKPPFLFFRSSKHFIVAAVCCMAFTDVFLYGIIVPVVPRALQERAGVPADEVQSWTSILLTTYGAALLVFSPIFGYTADQSRCRQLPLLAGLLMLAGATAVLCAGTSLALWIAGRALQGASCAMVWTVGLALLADTVKEHELGKYLGVIALAMSCGSLLGPLLGGVVYEHGGYYAVFAMSFALIGLDIVLRITMIEKKVARKYEAGCDDQMQETLPERNGKKEKDGAEISRGTQESTMIASKPWLDRLPPVLWLLSSRRLLVALFASMVYGIMNTSFDAVLPLFVQQTFGWSSNGSGLIFLAVFIPSFLSPWIGSAADRYGARLLIAGGFLLAMPFYVLLRLVTHKAIGQEILLCAILVPIGIGIALVSAPVFTEIVHIVYAKERQNPGAFGAGGATAQAYGLFNVAFAAGMIVGPLYAGFVRETAGWGTMGWGLGLICGVTSIPVLLVTGGWIGKRQIYNRERGDWDDGTSREQTNLEGKATAFIEGTIC
ncbi:hypothetical protein MMC22_010275 [Lobaria immixta]|nr:hypothetical protein [Lobaria immixta]